MTIEDIRALVAADESRTLELKKSTGELKDGMHSACAFLNSDGGWLIFGVAPKSLKIVGQEVTDKTQQEIAQLYPDWNRQWICMSSMSMCRNIRGIRSSPCTSTAGCGASVRILSTVVRTTKLRAQRKLCRMICMTSASGRMNRRHTLGRI